MTEAETKTETEQETETETETATKTDAQTKTDTKTETGTANKQTHNTFNYKGKKTENQHGEQKCGLRRANPIDKIDEFGPAPTFGPGICETS